MTHSELQQLNALREEVRRLKQQNESLRTRYLGVLYANEQAQTALALTKQLVGAVVVV